MIGSVVQINAKVHCAQQRNECGVAIALDCVLLSSSSRYREHNGKIEGYDAACRVAVPVLFEAKERSVLDAVDRRMEEGRRRGDRGPIHQNCMKCETCLEKILEPASSAGHVTEQHPISRTFT